ncbi:MAG: hypothetical protein ABSG57_02845 [Candidatus Bathyarchaeia archaeon]
MLCYPAFIRLLSDTGTITVVFIVSTDRRLRKRYRFLRMKKMSTQKYSECELTLRKESLETQNRERNG